MDTLGAELARLDVDTLTGLARALERDEARLTGGSWGSRDDGEGCLLSLAAWELGLADGESLMRRSVAAVRVPALFDELWALVLARSGDPEVARRIAHRLVANAIAVALPDGGPSPAPAPSLQR